MSDTTTVPPWTLYRPPKCHWVAVDRNCEPVLAPTFACAHTDEQIIAEWRAAVTAAGVIL